MGVCKQRNTVYAKLAPERVRLVDSRHALLSPAEAEVHSAAHPPGLSVPAHALSSRISASSI